MIPSDCRTEVRSVFQKLTSWKEEFSDIIESHRMSISKGVNDLVTEVSEMREELSVIKKERNMLKEKVCKLNEENRRLNAKLGVLEPAGVNLGKEVFPQVNFRMKPEDNLVVQNETEDREYDEGIPDATAEQDMEMLNDQDGSNIYETENVDNFVDSNPVMLQDNQGIESPDNAFIEDNEGPDDKSQGSLQFGMIYSDYPSFQRALENYEKENFVNFSQRSSARNHSETPEISDKTLFPFKRLHMSCIHSLTIKQRSTGKKKYNQTYLSGDCKAKIGLTLVTQQISSNYGKYRVTTFDSDHSKHDVNETSFKMQSQRKFKSSRIACQI